MANKNNTFDYKSIDIESIKCPITLELLNDPWILNGFSYEKEAIIRWLNESQLCPMTGVPMLPVCDWEYMEYTASIVIHGILIIENKNLKSLIDKSKI